MARKNRTRGNAPSAGAQSADVARPVTTLPQAAPAGRGGRFWFGLVLFQCMFGASVFVLTRAHYDRGSAAPVQMSQPATQSAGFAPRASGSLTASPSAPTAVAPSAESSMPELIARANQQFTEQDYGGAAVTYAAVVAREPGNVEMLNNLGISLHNAGRSEEALVRLQSAVEANPKHQRALLTLGFVQRALGNVEAAKSTLTQAIEVDATSRVGQEAQRLLGEM